MDQINETMFKSTLNMTGYHIPEEVNDFWHKHTINGLPFYEYAEGILGIDFNDIPWVINTDFTKEEQNESFKKQIIEHVTCEMDNARFPFLKELEKKKIEIYSSAIKPIEK